MNVKLFEMRDAATFIPLIAVKLNSGNRVERYLLGRSGYGSSTADVEPYVLVGRLDHPDEGLKFVPWQQPHPGRELAHKYIITNWDHLDSGDVIDVEYLRGDSKEPKVSERLTAPF